MGSTCRYVLRLNCRGDVQGYVGLQEFLVAAHFFSVKNYVS